MIIAPLMAKHYPMKQFNPFILVSVFVFLLTAPSTIFSQKTQTEHQPQKAVISKPASTIAPATVTKPTNQAQKKTTRVGSPVPQETQNQSTNARYKDGQPSRPMATNDTQRTITKSEQIASPSRSLGAHDSSMFIVSDPMVMNYRKAYRENRHCGCRGEISFINSTKDTLDMHFRYINHANTPSIDGVVLPPISLKKVYAPFYIVPGDTAKIRGTCRGALQYEALSRRPTRMQGKSFTPRLEFLNFVRMGCMPREVNFTEKP